MREEKARKLAEVAERVRVCRKCGLWREAMQGVPGEGDPEAEVMFIGEGPGFNEDRSGRPFVGQAGKLLEQLLSTIGVQRRKVFIANVVKHRPPNNRDPLPVEMEACGAYLDEQIRVIEPRVIVTFGRFSLNKFLPGEYISQVHGLARYVNWKGRKITVLPMYHPAAALRNGAAMIQLRQDFKKIPGLLGGKVNLAEEEKKQGSEQLNLC